MKVSGIIAEFNPLHNGHKYIIDVMKQSSDCTVAVISSSFVQRGEPAFFSKFARANTALKSGIDLVAELPCHWSCSFAENFAIGGVSLLKELSVSDIFFGTECDDINTLKNIAELDIDVSNKLKSGVTFAKMRQNEIENALGNAAATASAMPNNNLAIEYIKACKTLDFAPKLNPVMRQGVGHDDKNTAERFCSASYLRDNISELQNFVPKSAYNIFKNELARKTYINYEKYQNAVLTFLRRQQDFSYLPELSEGIENRLKKAILKSLSYDELLANIKTKRYTLARVRRLLASAFLRLDNRFCKQPVPYINVLAASKKGLLLLSKISNTSDLPLVIAGKVNKTLDNSTKMLLNKEREISDIYFSLTNGVMPCGTDSTVGIIK